MISLLLIVFLKNEIFNIQVCNVLVTLFGSFNIIAQSRILHPCTDINICKLECCNILI